jgi:hypothetical protein
MTRTDDLACKYSIVIVVFPPHRPVIGSRFPPDVDTARAGAVEGEVVGRLVAAFLHVEGDSYGWGCEQRARGGRRERTCRQASSTSQGSSRGSGAASLVPRYWTSSSMASRWWLSQRVYRRDEGERRVTGAVTQWQCAAFITWRVSPVTRPFMATLRPVSDIACGSHYNIVRTLTELVPSTRPSITTCSKIQPPLRSRDRQTMGERGHVSLEALSTTLTLTIKYASPEIRFAVS